MILQNISKAIREQNYYAVALEFVIVIAGVVIGFQINAWNAARRLHVQEQAFAERLHADILALQQRRLQIPTIWEGWRAQLAAAHQKLSPQSEAALLTPGECSMIIRSDTPGYNPGSLPSLEEVRASGDRSFIQDPALSAALSSYIQVHQERRDMAEQLIERQTDLRARYPDLFSLRLAIPEDGLGPEDLVPPRLGELSEGRCDLDAMRANNAFLNDFFDNTEMSSLYEAAVVKRTELLLSDLRASLEAYRPDLAQ